MPYKTGKMKGELLTGEIRRLISAHNRLSKITIPKGTKRDGLVKLVADNGFRIDHVKQKLIQTKATKMKPIDLPPVKKRAKPQPKPDAPKEIADKAPKAPEKFKVSQTRGKLNRDFKTKYKKTIYQVLGVKARIPPSEMKKVARELRLKNHPDRGGDRNEFSKINEAIEIMLSTYA